MVAGWLFFGCHLVITVLNCNNHAQARVHAYSRTHAHVHARTHAHHDDDGNDSSFCCWIDSNVSFIDSIQFSYYSIQVFNKTIASLIDNSMEFHLIFFLYTLWSEDADVAVWKMISIFCRWNVNNKFDKLQICSEEKSVHGGSKTWARNWYENWVHNLQQIPAVETEGKIDGKAI